MFGKRLLSPAGKHVVVTGASTGLGRATARHLANRGFFVFAGYRRDEDADSLKAEFLPSQLCPVKIDVTDEESIEEAASFVGDKLPENCLWGLVNNAGICISAPLECVSSNTFRRQLEVNLVGQLAVSRAFLPMLRAGGDARLVNITSGLGTVVIPYLGAYSAAQFAKEAMSDALRRELRPLGVMVSVVAPGAIWTPIWAKIAEQGREIIDTAPKAIADLYRDTYKRFLVANEDQARTSKTMPAHVAEAVCTAMMSSDPKPRYRVGFDVRRGSLLARILPDEALDAMLSSIVSPVAGAREDSHV